MARGWEVRIQLSDIKLPLTTFVSTPLAVWVQMVVASLPSPDHRPTRRSIRLNGLGVVLAVTRPKIRLKVVVIGSRSCTPLFFPRYFSHPPTTPFLQFVCYRTAGYRYICYKWTSIQSFSRLRA